MYVMGRLSGRIVRENYNGIQVLNYQERPSNLHSFLLASTERNPDKTAFECHSATATYEEFTSSVDRLAAVMKHTLEIEKGDRVALLLGNDSAFPLCFFAAS